MKKFFSKRLTFIKKFLKNEYIYIVIKVVSLKFSKQMLLLLSDCTLTGQKGICFTTGTYRSINSFFSLGRMELKNINSKALINGLKKIT